MSPWRKMPKRGLIGPLPIGVARLPGEAALSSNLMRVPSILAFSFSTAATVSNFVSAVRKCLLVLLALCLAVTQAVITVAHAQALTDDIDFDPPVIDHESLENGVAGELQVFSALVADDRGLERVTLFYRSTTGQDYQQVAMQQLAATDNYTASVDTLLDQKKIEYYIEALDTGGNRVLKGFPFFPLVRALEAPLVAPVAEQPAPAVASRSNSMLYIVLGVLAVGLIAGLAASSDDGGDSGGPVNPPGNTVPLTINISPP